MFAARTLLKVESSSAVVKSLTRDMSTKVAVLGAAGGIGQPLSMLLKLSQNIDELSCYDIVGTPGVAADLSHVRILHNSESIYVFKNLDHQHLFSFEIQLQSLLFCGTGDKFRKRKFISFLLCGSGCQHFHLICWMSFDDVLRYLTFCFLITCWSLSMKLFGNNLIMYVWNNNDKNETTV